MNKDRLTRLAQIATMKKDVDLQELSKIASRMSALQAEIDGLRAQRHQREQTVSLDPARMTGVDVAWQRWVDATITGHQSRMAELALARELFLGKARVSFGRADVLNRLTK